MIVEDDDRRGAAEGRFTKYFAGLYGRRVEAANRQHGCPENAVLRVEQYHTELFDRPRSEWREKIGRRVARSPQLDPRTWRVSQGPPTELHGRQHLRRLGGANSGDARQITASRSDEAVQPAARREQLVGDGQSVSSAAAAA